MAEILLTPLIAFAIYLALAGLLALVGRVLAGHPVTTPLQSSTYASGEESPKDSALPGYTGTFVIALFFAMLHIGVLMLGSGGASPAAVVYLVGLALALLALVIG